MKKKETKNNVRKFPNKFKQNQTENHINILANALKDEAIAIVSQRIDKYYDDFLKLPKYAECNKNLTAISEQIDALPDENIKKLFADYQHSLNQMHEYDLTLSYVLGMRDGVLVGVVENK